MCEKAAIYEGRERTSEFMKAAARLFAREVAEKVYLNGHKIAQGCAQSMDNVVEKLDSLGLGQAMKGNLKDMDVIAKELVR